MRDSNDANCSAARSHAALVELYQTASQQWIHAEQIRWALLYNYLMASTILLLAWAAVFASANSDPIGQRILAALAVGGVLLSGLWVALGVRAAGFVHAYRVAGNNLEQELIGAFGLSTGNAPFAVANNHRRTVAGLAKAAESARVLWLVPTVFLFLYILLARLSFGQVGGLVADVGIGVLSLVAVVFVAVAFRQLPSVNGPSGGGA